MNRRLDLAILYLRIAVGGMLLLHNIGEIQELNSTEINTTISVSMIIQTITAFMLIVGWRVRLAAATLSALGLYLLMLHQPAPLTAELELRSLYIFIYIYIFIAGAGVYSIDSFRGKKGQ